MDACNAHDNNQIRAIVPTASLRTYDEEYELRKRNAARWRNWESLVKLRGERYQDCRLSNFNTTNEEQEKVVFKLQEYLTLIDEHVKAGEGLLLYGPKGCGKDHLLMACARQAIGSDHSVHWVNGMDIFAWLRSTMNSDSVETEEDVYRDLTRPKVLWISDPAPPTGTLSEYQQSFLFRVLDYRYSHLMPTWVTLNVSSGMELDSRIGAQNGDRLRHGATAIFTNWESHRKVNTNVSTRQDAQDDPQRAQEATNDN